MQFSQINLVKNNYLNHALSCTFYDKSNSIYFDEKFQIDNFSKESIKFAQKRCFVFCAANIHFLQLLDKYTPKFVSSCLWNSHNNLPDGFGCYNLPFANKLHEKACQLSFLNIEIKENNLYLTEKKN